MTGALKTKAHATLMKTIKKRLKTSLNQKNCRSVKGLRENMECYEKDYWKVHQKILNFPTECTVNKTGIFDVTKTTDKINKFFNNIGTDLGNKIEIQFQMHLVHLIAI